MPPRPPPPPYCSPYRIPYCSLARGALFAAALPRPPQPSALPPPRARGLTRPRARGAGACVTFRSCSGRRARAPSPPRPRPRCEPPRQRGPQHRPRATPCETAARRARAVTFGVLSTLRRARRAPRRQGCTQFFSPLDGRASPAPAALDSSQEQWWPEGARRRPAIAAPPSPSPHNVRPTPPVPRAAPPRSPQRMTGARRSAGLCAVRPRRAARGAHRRLPARRRCRRIARPLPRLSPGLGRRGAQPCPGARRRLLPPPLSVARRKPLLPGQRRAPPAACRSPHRHARRGTAGQRPPTLAAPLRAGRAPLRRWLRAAPWLVEPTPMWVRLTRCALILLRPDCPRRRLSREPAALVGATPARPPARAAPLTPPSPATRRGRARSQRPRAGGSSLPSPLLFPRGAAPRPRAATPSTPASSRAPRPCTRPRPRPAARPTAAPAACAPRPRGA